MVETAPSVLSTRVRHNQLILRSIIEGRITYIQAPSAQQMVFWSSFTAPFAALSSLCSSNRVAAISSRGTLPIIQRTPPTNRTSIKRRRIPAQTKKKLRGGQAANSYACACDSLLGLNLEPTCAAECMINRHQGLIDDVVSVAPKRSKTWLLWLIRTST